MVLKLHYKRANMCLSSSGQIPFGEKWGNLYQWSKKHASLNLYTLFMTVLVTDSFQKVIKIPKFEGFSNFYLLMNNKSNKLQCNL